MRQSGSSSSTLLLLVGFLVGSGFGLVASGCGGWAEPPRAGAVEIAGARELVDAVRSLVDELRARPIRADSSAPSAARTEVERAEASEVVSTDVAQLLAELLREIRSAGAMPVDASSPAPLNIAAVGAALSAFERDEKAVTRSMMFTDRREILSRFGKPSEIYTDGNTWLYELPDGRDLTFKFHPEGYVIQVWD